MQEQEVIGKKAIENDHIAVNAQKTQEGAIDRSHKAPETINKYMSHLQNTIGNRAVEKLHRSGKLQKMVQAKFNVSKPQDPYEIEADNVADTIMRMKEPEQTKAVIQTKAAITPPVPISRISQTLRRQEEETAEAVEEPKTEEQTEKETPENAESIQAKSFPDKTADPDEINNNTESRIRNLKGRGSPLPQETKDFFERRFGANFDHVRVHTGEDAQSSSKAIRAKAYTLGSDIAFARGEYKPESTEGRKLIAHELTHVVQQGGTLPRLKSDKIAAKPAEDKSQNQPIQPQPPVNTQTTNKEKPKEGGLFGFVIKKAIHGMLKLIDKPLKLLGIKGEDIEAIISDPLGLLNNLVKSVKLGIGNFAANIGKHLMAGLTGWLFGTFSEAGLQIPEKFDLKGIFSIVGQILGLTWQNIRFKLVKRLGTEGEKIVSSFEKTSEFVRDLVTRGPIALWEKVQGELMNLKDIVFGGIIDWLRNTIITQALMRLVAFFNPAGAILQAIEFFVKIVMFLVERWNDIRAFVQSVVASIQQIAAGNIDKAATYIENSLARTIPIVIGFLARLLNISGIVKKVQEIIAKLRKPIDKAVDKVTGWLAKMALKVWVGVKKFAGKLIDSGKNIAGKIKSWWETRKTFKTADGENHTLFFEGKGKSSRLMVASDPTFILDFLEEKRKQAKHMEDPEAKKKTEQTVSLAIKRYYLVEKYIKNDRMKSQKKGKGDYLERKLQELIALLNQLGLGGKTADTTRVITFVLTKIREKEKKHILSGGHIIREGAELVINETVDAAEKEFNGKNVTVFSKITKGKVDAQGAFLDKIRVEDGGDTWDYRYVTNKGKAVIKGKKKLPDESSDMGREQLRDIVNKLPGPRNPVERGMLPEHHRIFLDFATNRKLFIIVRDSNKAALDHMRASLQNKESTSPEPSAAPKPMPAKSKTSKSDKSGNLGLVEFHPLPDAGTKKVLDGMTVENVPVRFIWDRLLSQGLKQSLYQDAFKVKALNKTQISEINSLKGDSLPWELKKKILEAKADQFSDELNNRNLYHNQITLRGNPKSLLKNVPYETRYKWYREYMEDKGIVVNEKKNNLLQEAELDNEHRIVKDKKGNPVIKSSGFFSDYDLHGIYDASGNFVEAGFNDIQEKLNKRLDINMIQHQGQDQPGYRARHKLGISVPSTSYFPAGELKNPNSRALPTKTQMVAFYAYFNLGHGEFKGKLDKMYKPEEIYKDKKKGRK